MEVKELASLMSAAFEIRERTDGGKFVALKDGHPQWMQDVCREAHGDMMPDDVRYGLIKESVDAIAEHDDIDEARDSVEPPIYTHELTAWLDSRTDRYGFCDESIEDRGEPFPDTLSLLTAGYSREQMEVFGMVASALESLADTPGEDED